MKSEELEFCRILLEKLKRLGREDRIFEGSRGANLTSIASSIFSQLSEKIHATRYPSELSNSSEVVSFINLVEEFLGIFEEEEISRSPIRKGDYLEFEKSTTNNIQRFKVKREDSYVEFGGNKIFLFDFHGEENIIRDVNWLLSNMLNLHLKKVSDQGERVEVYECL